MKASMDDLQGLFWRRSNVRSVAWWWWHWKLQFLMRFVHQSGQNQGESGCYTGPICTHKYCLRVSRAPVTSLFWSGLQCSTITWSIFFILMKNMPQPHLCRAKKPDFCHRPKNPYNDMTDLKLGYLRNCWIDLYDCAIIKTPKSKNIFHNITRF